MDTAEFKLQILKKWIYEVGGFFRVDHPSFPAVDLQLSSSTEIEILFGTRNRKINVNKKANAFDDFPLKLQECMDTPETYLTDPDNPYGIKAEFDRALNDLLEEIRRISIRNKIPFLRKLPWPQAMPFAVAFTHDVDLTRKYGLKGLLKAIAGGKLKEAFQVSGYLIKQKNPYWTFPELLKFYEDKNWLATFFFLARPREGFSYRYNILTPRFRDLLKEISDRGHEVALHSSLHAFQKPWRINKEKLRLEQALGATVAGVRQHYLRLRFPEAWQFFTENGLLYDSSCGFNERVGFRAGTTFPFQTFNIHAKTHYSLYEIPFSLMDYALFGSGREDSHHLENRLNVLVDEVQNCHGLLNILWHPSNLAEPPFRNAWKILMEQLQPLQFYQDTLKNILEWWQRREAVQIKNWDYSDPEIQFQITAPSPITNLALELFYPGEVKSQTGSVQVKSVGQNRHHIQLDSIPATGRVVKLKLI